MEVLIFQIGYHEIASREYPITKFIVGSTSRGAASAYCALHDGAPSNMLGRRPRWWDFAPPGFSSAQVLDYEYSWRRVCTRCFITAIPSSPSSPRFLYLARHTLGVSQPSPALSRSLICAFLLASSQSICTARPSFAYLLQRKLAAGV